MNTTFIAITPILLTCPLIAAARSRSRVLAFAAAAGWATLVVNVLLAVAALAGLVAADPVGLVAQLLTSFVGAIVLSFSRRFLRADSETRGYAAKTILLLGAVMLFAGARDMISLAIGWIASGWLLAALIGHAPRWPEAKKARRRTLATFIVGDIALVAGLAILGFAEGGMALDRLAIAPTAFTTLAALLIVIAASVRCALPPFQRWLSRSMTAPTPVSALMHAGFVNGGGILLIRFAPVLETAPLARVAAIGLGIVAALVGTAVTLVRPDVKRSLAGSTSAQMGFMLMTCGLGAYAAALWHLVAHGLFKAWLFLRSGSAIGAAAPAETVTIAPAAVAGIGVAAVAACLALGALYGAAVVPLTLALVAALVTAARLLAEPLLAAMTATILAAYAGGLVAVDHLLAHPSGPAIGGVLLAPAIVAVFMAAWLIQTLIFAGRVRPPAALYARLLNA